MTSRTPSRRERIAAGCILALLAGIGVGIWQVQKTPNPAVTVLAQAGPADADRPLEGAPIPIPPGFSAMGPPEVFDPERLSDKIDGKAELYLSAGFQRLSTQRLTTAPSDGSWMEVFAYDMETPRNAYAVFSAQQREGAEPVDRFRFAYRTENALFFVQGRFYVEVLSSAVPEQADRLLRVASAFAGDHPAAETAVSERELFPAEGLVPGSIALQSANGFGFEQLDDLFVARYRLQGAEAGAFLSRRRSAAAAEALAEAYVGFLSRFGGTPGPVEFPAPDARLVEIFGLYELVFTRGAVLAGVHEAEDAGQAVILGRQLYDRLSKEGP